MEKQPITNTPFSGVTHGRTTEELDREISEKIAEREAIAERQRAAQATKQLQEQNADMQRIRELQKGLKELDDIIRLPGKLTIEDAVMLRRKRAETVDEITALEEKYGVSVLPDENETPARQSAWPTIVKVVSLLVACWGIVVYSGNWILDKYPGAAIYNAVSFQKVLFGFSVFIAEITGVIIALVIFFPGMGRYFNPFNRDQMDFFNDFKQLTEWHRTLVSIFLFFALLLAFVMTVSGKLD
jgi:hypothetical protein